ncbi:MAG: hypothetical protein RBT33_01065 [Candidatus Dojkabacteria bacterium]|jgi:hypothetical protein|nr:hypothetical protein [Candidatus Dojkabacteria bacterium]
MDLVKYIIVGGICLFIGFILSILVRNIFTGIISAVLLFGGYLLWSLFNSAKKAPPTIPPQSPPSQNL